MESNAPQQSGTDAPVKSASRLIKLVPIIIIVILVAVAVAIVSRPTAGTRTTTGTSVSVVVGGASPAQTVEFPVVLQEGNDPGHEADHIIEPVRGLEGVADATLDWSSGMVLVVRFDPTVVSQAQLAGALASAGYLALPAE